MPEEKNSRVLYTLGLNDIEKKLLESGLEQDEEIRHYSARSGLDVESVGSGTLWTPWRVWKLLPHETRARIDACAELRKIIILDRGQEGPELDRALDQDFAAVVSGPLTPEKIREAMEKTREVTELFDDIMRMAREISLEREILARKTDALMFLNRIMTRAVESLNPVSILAGAREDLNMVLPVRSLQGIFWQHSAKSSVEAEVFLSFHEETDVQDQWLELLFAKVEELTSCQVSGYQLTYLMDPDGEAAADLGPDNDRLILLPLKAGGEHFGCLALLSGEPVRLGRDQSQVLVSAANHLGLALKNALLFRETKIRADYDALTRIYNRHYFDGRLSEEVQRQRRYQYDLSLLLLDLDHFKRINDVFGHQAGDMVLKEVGQVLLDGMRATDFAARYGGEEFVIILPHISKDQAARTAERLRRKVASRVFRQGGKDLRVTASVGVASLSPGSLETGAELLRRADEALYRAKAEGRDRVVVHGEAESAERERAGEM